MTERFGRIDLHMHSTFSDGTDSPEELLRKLTYVTTAGGTAVPEEYGFGYVRALAESFYGIPDVRLIRALGLDIEGADTEAILRSALDGNEL